MLLEDVGPQYRAATENMTAQQAADWWMTKWERPGNTTAGSAKHSQYLSGYNFQRGGVIPRKTNAHGGSGAGMVTDPSTFTQQYQQLSRTGRGMGLYDLQPNAQRGHTHACSYRWFG